MIDLCGKDLCDSLRNFYNYSVMRDKHFRFNVSVVETKRETYFDGNWSCCEL